jgi:hypothetical protein
MHHRCRDFLRINARRTGMHALPRERHHQPLVNKDYRRVAVCLARSGIARPRQAAAVTFLNIRS